MTSQPEAALTEAQAAYEAALNEWQELQRWRHFIQMELKAKVVDPAVEYISLLEARIASLEAEVAETKGDARLAKWAGQTILDYFRDTAQREVSRKARDEWESGYKTAWSEIHEKLKAAAQAPADAESGVT